MSNSRECYGGINIYDDEDYEFWVDYEKGAIILPQSFETSSEPWELNEEAIKYFEENIKELLEYLKE